jgi:hypothetical protein
LSITNGSSIIYLMLSQMYLNNYLTIANKYSIILKTMTISQLLGIFTAYSTTLESIPIQIPAVLFPRAFVNINTLF